MKKAVVSILLFLLVLTGWSQKKGKKKPAEKANTPVSASQPHDSTLRILGSEFVVDVDHLDIMINSKSPELFPVISPDGKTLYFSRKSHADNKFGVKDVEDIWYSKMVNGKWDFARNMETHNSMGSDYICQIVPPQKSGGQVSMILGNDYRVGGNKKAHMFMSHSTNGGDKWTKPQKLHIAGLKGFSEKTDCFMTRDRKFLIISWEAPGGLGEKDLWVSAAGTNNSYIKPVNLGRDVNTKGDDRSPFLLPDGRTLFFSSDGYKDTKGGHDIYVTHRNGTSWTSWTIPQNLGPQINGKLDELGFVIQEGTSNAFFCKGVSDTDTDIYSAEVSFGTKIVTIKGQFLDKITKKPVVGRILFIQNSTGNAVLNSSTDAAAGSFTAHVASGQKYHMFAISSKGKRSEPVLIDLQKITASNNNIQAPTVWFGGPDDKPEIDQEMLNALQPNSTIITSASGKKIPGPEIIQYANDSTRVGILKLVALSNISTYAFLNPKTTVLVNGFMDKQDEKKVKQRISEITDYLVKHGVDVDRIKNQVVKADPAKNETNTCKVEVQELIKN